MVNSLLMVDKLSDDQLQQSENDFEIEFDQVDKIDLSPNTVKSNSLNVNKDGD